MYDETLSPACQRGQCDDCPEQEQIADGSAWPIYCACTCHIPDPEQPDESDLLAQTFYERFYA